MNKKWGGGVEQLYQAQSKGQWQACVNAERQLGFNNMRSIVLLDEKMYDMIICKYDFIRRQNHTKTPTDVHTPKMIPCPQAGRAQPQTAPATTLLFQPQCAQSTSSVRYSF